MTGQVDRPEQPTCPGPRHLRLVHHQACTGGTLLSRALAALPQVVVLSEISAAGEAPPIRFDPLSPLSQLAAAYPGLRPPVELAAELLGRQLCGIHDFVTERGRQLIIRDHAHSDWMAPRAPRRGSFRQIAKMFDRVDAILTVRYPYASFLSLCQNRWHDGVRGYRDYCARYLAFLDDLGELPRIQYEAFCLDPSAAISAMANALSLQPAVPAALSGWQAQRLTGRSGRASESRGIRPLSFRGWSPQVEEELARLPDHAELCRRLAYPQELCIYADAQNRSALMHDPAEVGLLHEITTLARRLSPAAGPT